VLVDYAELEAGRRCSWVEPDELTVLIVYSAGWTMDQSIEIVTSRFCYTQSWICIVVELKSRELAGWMAYNFFVGHPEGN
jgi:hypothetical protein